jgi:hypothetical protein
VIIYARNNTLNDILTVSATVNDSYVDIILNPIIIAEDIEESIDAQDYSGTKVIYTANYFHTQTPLVV